MPVFTNHEKGLFNGTEEITLVPAPARGLTIVTMLRIINTDSEDITLKIRILDRDKLGFDDEYIRIVNDITLATSEYLEYDGVVCVLNPKQTLVAELSGVVTTTEPEWMSVWARETY
jgi:hypothetical protein